MRALRPVLLCLLLAVPAVAVRVSGTELASGVALLVFGVAVVASSFVLAWAAEAAEVDISGGLAIAVLAVIAVLPEYAVDLYFAYTAGSRPEYVQFAAANMTGSNRLLLGLGWSLVVLLALHVARRRTGRPVRSSCSTRRTASRSASWPWPRCSPWSSRPPGRSTSGWAWCCSASSSGTSCAWPPRAPTRSTTSSGPPPGSARCRPGRAASSVVAMFVVAALVILVSAEPFADALVHSGQALGIDQFLLVQWLAPLSSEAPELIIAMIFALRGKGAAALGLLVSAKVNQWTLLVGSLPVAYLAGGGSTSLVLDARQVEEFALTIAQTIMGIAVLVTLRFPRWAAWTLLALFAVQFGVPGTGGRLVLTGVYLLLAAVALVANRRSVLPTLTAPFRRTEQVVSAAAGEVRELQPTGSASSR